MSQSYTHVNRSSLLFFLSFFVFHLVHYLMYVSYLDSIINNILFFYIDSNFSLVSDITKDLHFLQRFYTLKSHFSYSFTQIKFLNNLSINNELAVEQFAQSVVQNSVEVFCAMQKLQNQVQQHDNITLFFVSSSSVYSELNSQFLAIIAQIITQILNNQFSFIIQLSANSVAVIIAFRFKKLSDISEYKKDKD